MRCSRSTWPATATTATALAYVPIRPPSPPPTAPAHASFVSNSFFWGIPSHTTPRNNPQLHPTRERLISAPPASAIMYVRCYTWPVTLLSTRRPFTGHTAMYTAIPTVALPANPAPPDLWSFGPPAARDLCVLHCRTRTQRYRWSLRGTSFTASTPSLRLSRPSSTSSARARTPYTPSPPHPAPHAPPRPRPTHRLFLLAPSRAPEFHRVQHLFWYGLEKTPP